eukprot:TRINITY_DN9104_c0_g2_i6.p3 TRINITY_DN9104_c0_g2~~TRINITY_DN9104_c0_g2_i6.p3  ORF type:complete len:186 (-),score=-12.45 TRINITY_DN9104_c0_g2_i6:1703-2260(-)
MFCKNLVCVDCKTNCILLPATITCILCISQQYLAILIKIIQPISKQKYQLQTTTKIHSINRVLSTSYFKTNKITNFLERIIKLKDVRLLNYDTYAQNEKKNIKQEKKNIQKMPNTSNTKLKFSQNYQHCHKNTQYNETRDRDCWHTLQYCMSLECKTIQINTNSKQIASIRDGLKISSLNLLLTN